MTKVVFIEHNGNEHPVEVQDGRSVMQAAVDNLVPGILGDCGGSCNCATCHAYIDPAWMDRMPAKSSAETDTLDGALEVTDYSRLTCQVTIRPELDGLVVRIPRNQF